MPFAVAASNINRIDPYAISGDYPTLIKLRDNSRAYRSILVNDAMGIPASSYHILLGTALRRNKLNLLMMKHLFFVVQIGIFTIG
jgi:hypothetical protein